MQRVTGGQVVRAGVSVTQNVLEVVSWNPGRSHPKEKGLGCMVLLS